MSWLVDAMAAGAPSLLHVLSVERSEIIAPAAARGQLFV